MLWYVARTTSSREKMRNFALRDLQTSSMLATICHSKHPFATIGRSIGGHTKYVTRIRAHDTPSGRRTPRNINKHHPTWLWKTSEPKEAAKDAATRLRMRADSSSPTSVSSSARFMFTKAAVVTMRKKAFVRHNELLHGTR